MVRYQRRTLRAGVVVAVATGQRMGRRAVVGTGGCGDYVAVGVGRAGLGAAPCCVELLRCHSSA
jgi:hypothetical protein